MLVKFSIKFEIYFILINEMHAQIADLFSFFVYYLPTVSQFSFSVREKIRLLENEEFTKPILKHDVVIKDDSSKVIR